MNKLWKTTLFESELTPITLISECAEALSSIISHCTGHYCSVLSIIFGKSILPSSILALPKQSLLQKTTYLQWRGIVIAIRFIVRSNEDKQFFLGMKRECFHFMD